MECGDLRFYSGNTCAKSASRYYSHSANMTPGESSQTHVSDVLKGGELKYAACYGSVGFGNNGEWKDHPDGSFECLEAPK